MKHFKDLCSQLIDFLLNIKSDHIYLFFNAFIHSLKDAKCENSNGELENREGMEKRLEIVDQN